MSAFTSATLIFARSLAMSALKIVLTSFALRMAAQSTFSGSTETNGAGGAADGEGDADGLGDAADGSPLTGAPLAAEPLAGADASAASDPDGTAPLDRVTTAVTVRRVVVSDPHPETISSPAIAAASTR
jgi:hypothetical protein